MTRINGVDVEINKADVANYLRLSSQGLSIHGTLSSVPWRDVNRVIRHTDLPVHDTKVEGLIQNAKVIQHVLRHSFLPKAGDGSMITTLLSYTTYAILSHTDFDEADLFLGFFETSYSACTPTWRKAQNLVYGQYLSYLILRKYSLVSEAGHDYVQPVYFSNGSFHTIYGGMKGRGKKPAREAYLQEEGEEDQYRAGSSAARQPSPPPPHTTEPPSTGWETHFEQLNIKVDHLAEEVQSMRTEQQSFFDWARDRFRD